MCALYDLILAFIKSYKSTDLSRNNHCQTANITNFFTFVFSFFSSIFIMDEKWMDMSNIFFSYFYKE